jgi:hypothetical protein
MGWWRRENLNGGVLIDEKEIIVNSAGIVVDRKFACYRLPGTNTGSSASTGTRAGTSTNTNTGSRGLRVGITISHPRGRPPYIVFGEMER